MVFCLLRGYLMRKRQMNISWRIVPSLPRIMVSSEGLVMLIPETGHMPNGRPRQYGGMPTYGQWSENRYIFLYEGRSYKVARLVCEAFHGAPPEGKMYCLHIDENSRNNKPDNLKWGTQKENLNAPGFIQYCKSRTGENSATFAKWNSV